MTYKLFLFCSNFVKDISIVITTVLFFSEMRAKKKRFADHLLKGLKGDADLNFDDEIVIDELYSYV